MHGPSYERDRQTGQGWFKSILCNELLTSLHQLRNRQRNTKGDLVNELHFYGAFIIILTLGVLYTSQHSPHATCSLELITFHTHTSVVQHQEQFRFQCVTQGHGHVDCRGWGSTNTLITGKPFHYVIHSHPLILISKKKKKKILYQGSQTSQQST